MKLLAVHLFLILKRLRSVVSIKVHSLPSPVHTSAKIPTWTARPNAQKNGILYNNHHQIPESNGLPFSRGCWKTIGFGMNQLIFDEF